MLTKSLILGIMVFLLDLAIFSSGLIKGKNKKISDQDYQKIKRQLEFNIPFSLLVQLFFAIVLVYTYMFLLTFKAFEKSLSGGLTFALVIYIPMLYLLVNSWLWGDKDFRVKMAPGIFSWLAKFLVTGIYLGLFI